ncbi:unnamed protein product [Closterium sp. Yama58-4]|nr:unnamed protein product [Closterium sp. Yama58-4]
MGSLKWEAKLPLPSPYGVVAPKHVTAVCHVSACHPARLVTACLDNSLRVFDLLLQPRPLRVVSLGSVPIRSLAAVWSKGGEECSAVAVGTGMGEMKQVDLTHGRITGAFKGECAGSIRSLAMHPSLPLVASCGLDRYLRIHHLHTRRLVAKVFLKQPLNFLCFLPEGVASGAAASGP